MGELTVGSASTMPPKSRRFTNLGVLAQNHECAIVQPQQEHDPSPSIPYFAVPPQEGYIGQQGPASTPFFQSFQDGDMEAAS